MEKKVVIEIRNPQELYDIIHQSQQDCVRSTIESININREPLYTTNEMCKHLKMGRTKFSRLVKNGTIPVIRIGNSLRFERVEILKSLKL